MTKDILLSGMSSVPSDFACKDGQLFMSVNLLSEGQGEIHNLSSPESIFDIPSGYKFLYVHETSYYKHFIFMEETEGSFNYYFVDADDKDHVFTPLLKSSSFSCVDANAIGNTLMLFLDGEIHYFLFKSSSYKDLGNSLPEISLQFGLLGEPVFYSQTEGEDGGRNIHFSFEVWPKDKSAVYKSEDLRSFADLVEAPINLMIKNQVTDKGMFCFPFFVRYALRLYDGSLVHHSAPILMYHSSSDGILPFFRRLWWDGTKLTDCNIDVFLIRSQLTYKVLDAIDTKFLDKWKDIVKSVDVFISSPVYTYKSDSVVDDLAFVKFSDTACSSNKFVGKLKSGCFKSKNVSGNYFSNYASFSFLDLFNASAADMQYEKDTTGGYPNPVKIAAFTDDEMRKKFESVSSFYLLKSISLNEIFNARNNSAQGIDNVIEIEKDYLSSLVNREAMTDDFLSHDRLKASVSYVYNKRLNIAKVSRSLFDGFPIMSMFPRYEGDIVCSYSGDSGEKIYFEHIVNNIKQNAFTATIEDGDKSIKVYTESNSPFFVSGNKRIPTLFFYPNTGLKEIVWWRNFKTFERIDAKMHDFLNLGFCVLDSAYLANYDYRNESLSQNKGDKDKLITDYSQIYTSSVSNPFYFPSSGINDVGIGQVFSMAAAVKALSQGQFGQFPLYAFTSNGVWALSVGSDGSYTSVSPVSRDVCISPSSICSLDSSVVFATRRGIMQLSGSTASCITDSLKDNLSEALETIDLSKIFSFADIPQPTDISLINFLGHSGIIYDYPHQRLLVFNTINPYCYIYSLQTHAWGLLNLDITDSVNSYPNALAVIRSGDNMVLSDLTLDGEIMNGILITRPFKINADHLMTEINDLILRGNIDYFSKVNLILFGTRDYRNYVCVSSSSNNEIHNIGGSPFKAFVLVVVSNLEWYDDSFYAFSVKYNPRLNNKIR